MNIPKGQLLPCPICGKYPKFKDLGIFMHRAQCKPLIGKPHLVVITQYTFELVDAWNETVMSLILEDNDNVT